MTGREKWERFFANEDVGPMVCPLCDKWGVGDIEYSWMDGAPEPFAPEENRRQFCGQIMMAKTFGWDPLFYAAIKFTPNDARMIPSVRTSRKGHLSQTVTTIDTPYGELTRIDEHSGITNRTVKEFLDSESDYEKMLWYTVQSRDFQRDAALREGRELRAAAGDFGMIGTWASPSAMLTEVQDLFYHMEDYPAACDALRAERAKSLRIQLEVYREAGFDFLFYCISGTETISPGFFNEWIKDEAFDTIRWWSSLGGFTLWHSCGHLKAFLEKGMYNEMMPEVLESLSEPPVGNIPSLAWARERLDPKIVTKGNIPLNILLEGTPEDVREEVRRVKNETRGYRHIIGLSDNILNGTPSQNLRAFADEGYKAF
jgi:hypothetical protein